MPKRKSMRFVKRISVCYDTPNKEDLTKAPQNNSANSSPEVDSPFVKAATVTKLYNDEEINSPSKNPFA